MLENKSRLPPYNRYLFLQVTIVTGMLKMKLYLPASKNSTKSSILYFKIL